LKYTTIRLIFPFWTTIWKSSVTNLQKNQQ
jgi:hypothetical protein